jgi:hypothetical protein
MAVLQRIVDTLQALAGRAATARRTPPAGERPDDVSVGGPGASSRIQSEDRSELQANDTRSID